MNILSSFNCKTEVIFGLNSLQNIGEILLKENFKRVFIICDKGIENSGILDRVLDEIGKSNVEVLVYSNVEPNPSSKTVALAKASLKEFNGDVIVGLGGGSPLDTAKAVSVLATNEGEITDYEGVDKIQHEGLPLIAIPTTAGTASEVTVFTVITDLEKEYKVTIGGRNLAARWAIMDPMLTLSLPSMLTASTGLDALVHAIESYVSKKAYFLSETLALEAIKKISSSLRTAVYNPDNIEARSNMLYGSLIAGLAFNNTRLGNVHAMSHPLSAIYHVPHGIANSVLLPHVMEFNYMASSQKFADIAIAMGANQDSNDSTLTLSEKAIDLVKDLSRDIGIPSSFKNYHVKESSIDNMVKDAMKSGNIEVNPRKTVDEDLAKLYKLTI